MICWVRSARRAAPPSAGRAPRRARSCAGSGRRPGPRRAPGCVVRTTLLSTDWAVRREPAVWTWKRHIIERGVLRAEAVAHDARPHPARGAELGHLLEQLAPGGEEERQPRRRTRRRPGRATTRRLDVGDAVGEREGELLGGRRARLAHVVAADRDRVPARQLAGAELEDVGHEAHRRLGRIDVRAARDVLLEDVVLDGAAEPSSRATPWRSAAAT